MTDAKLAEVLEWVSRTPKRSAPVRAIKELACEVLRLRKDLHDATLAIHDLQQEQPAYERGEAAARAKVLGMLLGKLARTQQVARDEDEAEAAYWTGREGTLKEIIWAAEDLGSAALLPPDALAVRVRKLEEALGGLFDECVERTIAAETVGDELGVVVSARVLRRAKAILEGK